MRTAEFDIGLRRGEGEIQRINQKTIVVKMRRGGKSKIIKRHIEKHRVVIQEEE
jgi:hypothetical protein